MTEDFKDPMSADLKAAQEARSRNPDPSSKSSVALGQIADQLIQLRWQMEDIRATLRLLVKK
jgi:hypothetical protein